jgi:hypothetical protein
MDTNDVIRISEMGQTHLLALFDRISRGCVNSAQSCLGLHIVGLADLDGEVRHEMVMGMLLLVEFERQVQDKELIDNIVLLRQNLQGIVDSDENIISMYAKFYFGGVVDKRKLKRRIYKSRIDGEGIPDAILLVAAETEKLVNRIVGLQKKIDARIRELTP